MTMNKKAALEKLPMLLKEASQHLATTSAKLAELTEEHKTAVHQIKAMKLAQRMTERGFDPETSWEQKVASLQAMTDEKLATMEQAIELAQAPLSLPKVANQDQANPTNPTTFDDFILSQSAFS